MLASKVVWDHRADFTLATLLAILAACSHPILQRAAVNLKGRTRKELEEQERRCLQERSELERADVWCWELEAEQIVAELELDLDEEEYAVLLHLCSWVERRAVSAELTAVRRALTVLEEAGVQNA